MLKNKIEKKLIQSGLTRQTRDQNYETEITL